MSTTTFSTGVTVIEADWLNDVDASTYGIRAIALGGTGASTAADARTNLGLGSVDNTSDIDKPVSTAQQTALDLKANLVSPSFTTPALGDATATSLQSPIGNATPNSGAFTTLSATGTVAGAGFTAFMASPPAFGGTAPNTGAFTTLSATGIATFAAGAVGTPAITTAGDTNTGVWFPAADTVAISVGGAEALRVTSAKNLGLGVTPAASNKLQIGGTFNGATTGYGLRINGSIDPSVVTVEFATYATGTTVAAGTLPDFEHYFASQGTLTGTVTRQYGFYAASNLTGAGTNYGFYNAIAASSGRWGFYGGGTAANAYAGLSSFGKVTAPTSAVDTTSFGTNLVTNTAGTYTVLTTDGTIVQTTAGSTYTLPTASSFTGRILKLVTQFAGAVISASSNVVPIAGGAAGTAILAATAGKYAVLQSNGTNWLITEAN